MNRQKFKNCEFLIRCTEAGGIDLSLKGEKEPLVNLMLAVMNELPEYANCINELYERFHGQGAKIIKLS